MVKVAVIGAGRLGIKIAGDLAYHGHQVRIYDKNKTILNSVHNHILEDKRQLRQDRLLIHPSLIGQVICLSRLEETVKGADFVFEVVSEDLKIKQELFEKISHLCDSSTIIATSSLRLNLSSIFEKTSHNERALGVRFLFPVYCIPEVEISLSPSTSTEALTKVHKFLENAGKTPFLRSGNEPFILTEDQREMRREERRKQVERNQYLGGHDKCLIPELAHFGNFAPPQDDNSLHSSYSDKDCSVCMDHIRDCVLHPCHHLCTCFSCGEMLLHRLDGCPICRKDIMDVIRVYYS